MTGTKSDLEKRDAVKTTTLGQTNSAAFGAHDVVWTGGAGGVGPRACGAEAAV